MSEVRTSGPLFDGRAEMALHESIGAIRRKLAERGENMVRASFAGAIREDHGAFLASITTADSSQTYTSASGHHTYTLPVYVGTDEEAVTTDLATYGPWLEGVGSRNSSTRFGGYHGFRHATDELDRAAGQIADETIRPYVERMNE